MSICTDPDNCGRSQQGAGRPRKGWIKTHTAGTQTADAWWCSPECLIADLTHAGHHARQDVASCPACINRHDRDHRCGICNAKPHIIRAAPRPTPLYHNARPISAQPRKEPPA